MFRRAVIHGPEEHDIVNSGLEPGSRVIVTGATIVRDGDTVRPIQ